MTDRKPIQSQQLRVAAGCRLPGLPAEECRRLDRTVRREPRAVLGVVEYWLAAAALEGSSRVDS